MAGDLSSVPSKQRRAEMTIIDGYEVFSFSNELELEYFTNLEEPLTRKILPFRGFDDEDDSINILKFYFDRQVKEFSVSKKVSNQNDTPSEFPRIQITFPDGKDDPSIVKDSCNVRNEVTELVSIEANEKPIEVIEIDSDTDDEVVIIEGDTPFPKPLSVHICHSCGKERRKIPRPPVNPHDSIRKDEISIVTELVDDSLSDDNAVESTSPLPPSRQCAARPASLHNSPITPMHPVKPVITPTVRKPSKQSFRAATKQLQSCDLQEPLLNGHSNHPNNEEGFPTPPVSPQTASNESQNEKMPTSIAPVSVKVISGNGKSQVWKLDGAKSKILHSPPQPHRIPLPSLLTSSTSCCKSKKHPNYVHIVAEGKSCDDSDNKSSQGGESKVFVQKGANTVSNELTHSTTTDEHVKNDFVCNKFTQTDPKTISNVVDSPQAISIVTGENPKAWQSSQLRMTASTMTLASGEDNHQLKTNQAAQISAKRIANNDVKSVIENMVDYVCRREEFSHPLPMDQPRSSNKPCLTVPCKNEWCLLGCICISLSKRWIRRVRCSEPGCIFGCVCHFTRQGSDGPIRAGHKKINGSITRHKQILSIPNNNSPKVATLKDAMPVKKPTRMLSTSPAGESNHNGTSQGFPPSAFSTHTNPLHQFHTLSTMEKPRRFFGREKIPIPDQALFCLTPGIGYVPIDEITSSKVVIHDPFTPTQTRDFCDVKQATDWLNNNLKPNLDCTMTSLRWAVATKSMIESKGLHRMNIYTLLSPNCVISRTGVTFT